MTQCKIRQMTAEDKPFIFNSWLKTFRDANFVRGVRHNLYYKAHHDIIDSILTRGQCLIACDESDPTRILGYAVSESKGETFTLHWVYVRQNLTRQGIGTALIAALDAPGSNVREYSHHTLQCGAIMEKFGLTYNPYTMMTHLSEKTS